MIVLVMIMIVVVISSDCTVLLYSVRGIRKLTFKQPH